MRMPLVREPFTREDWERLPERFPAQLIDGWLVKDAVPSYDHQAVVSALLAALFPLVGTRRALPAPYAVYADRFNVFLPDVVVVHRAAPPGTRYAGPPMLAIEVLSPSTQRRDRARKAPRMLDAGVAEVWLVDPVARRIEVLDRDGVRVFERDQPADSRALPGLRVTADALCGGVD